MFKCYDCEATFFEPRNVSERVGEYHGEPAYTSYACCPECGGAFGKAVQCKECDEWFFDDELTEGVCDECVEEIKAKYRYDIKGCYELAKTETQSVEINSFLASQYSVADIEELILKDLLQNGEVDCSNFINEDDSWFIERVMEVRENEQKASI